MPRENSDSDWEQRKGEELGSLPFWLLGAVVAFVVSIVVMLSLPI